MKKIMCLMLLAIFFCLYHYNISFGSSEKVINESIQYNTSPKDGLKTFSKWNVTHSIAYSALGEKTLGINLNTSSIKGTHKDFSGKLFISLHSPSVGIGNNEKKDCYKDFYISIFCKNTSLEFGLFDLFYSVDNEEPIKTRMKGFIKEDGIVKIFFKPNVMNFFRKCQNHKKIDFYLRNAEKDGYLRHYVISFSLQGLAEAYRFGFERLHKEGMVIVDD